MSSQEHIHRECKVLPVKDHSVLLTKQHTAGCILETSPGNRLLGLPPPQGNLKPAHLAHLPEVREKFRGLTHKDVIKSLHTTAAVAKTLFTYQVNRVIQDNPLDINPEEKQIPRAARSELARLRSGFSKNLNSYLHRLDESVPYTCPDCIVHQHTTNHLFSCTSNPTDLDPVQCPPMDSTSLSSPFPTASSTWRDGLNERRRGRVKTLAEGPRRMQFYFLNCNLISFWRFVEEDFKKNCFVL